MSDQPTSSSLSPKTIIALVLGVLAVIFVAQNTSKGEVNFLFWDFSMPAWIWILILLVVGVIIGSVFPWFRPKKKSNKR